MPKRKNSRQKFTVEGADELQAALSRISDEARVKAMRSGLDEASAFVLQDMKSRVKRRSGDLQRSLVRRVNTRNGVATSAAIGPKKVKGQWWSARGRWLEFGTRAHGKGGGNTRPQPFMRPSLDNNANQVYRIMAANMWAAIRRVT